MTLNMHLFRTLIELRKLTADSVREYNDERPHESLNNITPWQYLALSQTTVNNFYSSAGAKTPAFNHPPSKPELFYRGHCAGCHKFWRPVLPPA
ncbi:MAG: transposase [Porticoccaceae bacterium]|nr:transposase [Porticoccaceae bacterium]